MHSSFRKVYHSIVLLVVIVIAFLSNMTLAQPIETVSSDSLAIEHEKLLKGEVLVVLSDLPDGVTGVEGHIYIAAPPKKVWEVITDYDNHKKFVPNILDSGLI